MVKWGPKCVTPGETCSGGGGGGENDGGHNKYVFTVGDGIVLQHNLFAKDKAVNLNDVIFKV